MFFNKLLELLLFLNVNRKKGSKKLWNSVSLRCIPRFLGKVSELVRDIKYAFAALFVEEGQLSIKRQPLPLWSSLGQVYITTYTYWKASKNEYLKINSWHYKHGVITTNKCCAGINLSPLSNSNYTTTSEFRASHFFVLFCFTFVSIWKTSSE